MDPVFVLVDVNNFYASCEQFFDPSLRRRPLIVLSNNNGCVITRSDEAKTLGIKMGTPLFKIQHLVEEHDVQTYSSNYELYGDMSQRVMGTLQEFTPAVEIYSIDEAFMELDGGSSRSLRRLGLEIQQKVYQWTGVPVSIGMAETKTLAKVANRIAKKSAKTAGVLDLTHSPYQEKALEGTPVEEVWGIGRAYSKLLKDEGISTALALRDANLRWVRKQMTVVGARIVMELRGISCLPLEACPPSKKSITCTRTFGIYIETLAEIREAVAVYTTRVAERLRRAGLAASVITVFIQTDRFHNGPQYQNTATRSLIYPTDASQELLDSALKALERIFQPGYKYRKAGVLLSGLVPADQLTTRMYDDTRWERFRRVMEAVDYINRKYGRDTIRFTTADPNGRWKTTFPRCSPHYTTRLSDVPVIH
jgi:DNA polymerase V